LQIEINDLKAQVKYLKTEVMALKTAYLTIKAKLALLQSQKTDQEIPSSIPVDISGISEAEFPTTVFTNNFQNYFSKMVFYSPISCRRHLC